MAKFFSFAVIKERNKISSVLELINTAVAIKNNPTGKMRLNLVKQNAKNNDVPIRKEYLKQAIPSLMVEMSFNLFIVVS